MKLKARTVFALLVALIFATGLSGCRRVVLVGNSLLGCSREAVVKAINGNNGNSWVYTEHIWGGSTAYNNPINQEIYGSGMAAAFQHPDVAVLSFATNDMLKVAHESIRLDSAIQAMQTLINQAVASGAMCIVLLESSHRLNGDHDVNPRFEKHMDEWFYHWHEEVGEQEYLGIPYNLLIANISEEVEANMDNYIEDYIHFTQAGADLAAKAIVEQINECPEGRWNFGKNTLKSGVTYPKNPHLEYTINL
jgi:lysophospholipase L1-like esterase